VQAAQVRIQTSKHQYKNCFSLQATQKTKSVFWERTELLTGGGFFLDLKGVKFIIGGLKKRMKAEGLRRKIFQCYSSDSSIPAIFIKCR
jgi:hypothetical protein